MNLLEMARLVVRALLTHKIRTLLTVLGITLGVGTPVLLSSVMLGALASINASVEDATGRDLIKVSERPRRDLVARPRPFVPQDLKALSRIPAPVTVWGVMERRATLSVAQQERDGFLVGATMQSLSQYQLSLAQGRFINAEDERARRNVAVIGATLAQEWGGGAACVGQSLMVAGQRYRIVGVLAAKPSMAEEGNRTWNRSALVPQPLYLAQYGVNALDGAVIKVGASGSDLTRTVKRSVRLVRDTLWRRDHKPETLAVEAMAETGGDLQFLKALRILNVAVSTFCLGVGGINIMNILLVTVRERTREIGIRLALGAQRQDIRVQFLLEAAGLGLLGAAIGVLGALAIAWLISIGVTHFLAPWPFMIVWTDVGVAVLSAVVTCLVFGLWPATVAARQPIVACLRYE